MKNINQIISEVQAELNKNGANWKLEKLFPNSEVEDVLREGNKRIRFSFSRHAAMKGKVVVSGIRPLRKSNQQVDIDEPSAWIGVSVSRGSKAIAESINKRLLPDHERQVLLTEERIAEMEKEESDFSETKQRIAQIMEVPVRHNGSYYKNIKDIHLQVTPEAKSSIKFDFTCTTEQAEKILSFIKNQL